MTSDMIPGLFTPYSEHAAPRGLQNAYAADLSSYHNICRMLDAHGVVFTERIRSDTGTIHAVTMPGSPNAALWACFRSITGSCRRRGDSWSHVKCKIRHATNLKQR